MNNRKYLLGVLIISLVACSDDVLDKAPLDSASTDNFFFTADELTIGVNGIYEVFQGDIWGGSFIHTQPHLESATENVQLVAPWEHGYYEVSVGTMSPDAVGIVGWKWREGFKGVGRANIMLDNIKSSKASDVSEEDKLFLEAEVRFLRAFFYNEMMTVYGDLPILRTVVDPSEIDAIGRSSREEVLEFILEDFDFAIANLKTEPYRGDLGRPTLQAALGYAGKANLYAKRYQAAAELFTRAMQLEGSAVGLDENYESLFNGTNETSNEIIFSIQYAKEGPEGNFFSIHYSPVTSDGIGSGWNSLAYLTNLLDAYKMTDGLDPEDSNLYDPNNPFENRDPRFKQSWFLLGDVYKNDTIRLSNLPAQTANDETGNYLEVTTRKWVGTTDEVDGQFSDSNNQRFGGTDYVMMRYADILLMYAEAQNELSGPDASVYSAVNKVRARSGMPEISAGLSKDAMQQVIRDEREVEFMMEGIRYYDLIRWGIAEDVIPSVVVEPRTFDPAKNYLWPIPQFALDNGPNIDQNPGY